MSQYRSSPLSWPRSSRRDGQDAALSDETGVASFVHVDSAPEYSGFKERSYHGVTDVRKHQISVRTERLDDALPETFQPGLIKIDVEGAEMLVLRGAKQTLRRFGPTIIFEHGIGASERYGTSDVYDLLVGELDMRIVDLTAWGRTVVSNSKPCSLSQSGTWSRLLEATQFIQFSGCRIQLATGLTSRSPPIATVCRTVREIAVAPAL
jgi:hypothetical protein